MIRIRITCSNTDRSPNVLRHVKRARRSISITLFRVHQERESFAPFIVIGCHRIDEREFHHIDST
jgi:hypothetical protein